MTGLRHMRRIVSSLIGCLLLASAAQAQSGDACDARTATAVAKSAGIALKSHDGIAASACKPWPHDRGKLLSAFAFASGTEDEKRLVVAIVDAASGRVASSYESTVIEDAAVQFGPGSLRIDTARYQLAETARAFGVRFNSAARGASCADGTWSDELTLFIRDGDTLRPVLEGLAMTRSEARQGCFGNGAQELVYDEAKLSLSLAGTRSHGLADLVVNARISRQGNDGATKAKPRSERYILRYDGSTYGGSAQRPWWLVSFPPGS